MPMKAVFHLLDQKNAMDTPDKVQEQYRRVGFKRMDRNRRPLPAYIKRIATMQRSPSPTLGSPFSCDVSRGGVVLGGLLLLQGLLLPTSRVLGVFFRRAVREAPAKRLPQHVTFRI